ncbi:MAG: outer membrane protein assembly factor BamA [Bacteroidia bacterium]
MPIRKLICFFFLYACPMLSMGQVSIVADSAEAVIDYATPREFEIAGITVSGVRYLDEKVLIALSGLNVGDKVTIPGEKISKAIENLWKQGLLSDIRIVATRIVGNSVFLEFRLEERPRLSRFSFEGVTKSEADKIREKVKLVSGKIITEDLVQNVTNEVLNFYVDKGFFNAAVRIDLKDESNVPNSQILTIVVDKKKKVKVNSITIEGVAQANVKKLKRKMKETKEKRFYRLFSVSKFIQGNFEKDKESVVAEYRKLGFRDAKVVFDTVFKHSEKTVDVILKVSEGPKYYFRNINWVGNTKYAAADLERTLNIKKGELFNQKKLDEGLFGSQSGRDITSLYMDNGYLFFQVTPVEVAVNGDSIDYEMRIYEGKQAIVNKITVVGNTKTNDKVVMREIRTLPGQLFSRSDIIRTQRELAQLGYFDQEKLGVNPKPNPQDGTVDIEYVVEERPSDQIELSGGWGAGQVVGTLGVTFSNFSAANFFKKGAWTPLPSGDGQRLSLRAQTNGKYFQSYSISFTEPWLGGKKPNSLTVSAFRSVQSNGFPKSDASRQSIGINGVSVGLGQRLRIPDDYFSVYHELNYQYYELTKYSSTFLFSDGYANNINFQETISRNSVDAPIYPRTGSQFSLTLQLTPPYSLFNDKDYSILEDQEKYKFIEYHKWKFNAAWFTPLAWNKLVLHARASFGFLGYYDKGIGQSPFERFYLGGDGLSGYSLDGREIIAQRGYPNNSLNPRGGGTIYDKYTMELRYPLSLNPSATIYVMGFLEAGNAFARFREYSPFDVKRAAGAGVRIFLPMFGLLGLDWGYGFDNVPGLPNRNGGEFHFTIGQQF